MIVGDYILVCPSDRLVLNWNILFTHKHTNRTKIAKKGLSLWFSYRKKENAERWVKLAA